MAKKIQEVVLSSAVHSEITRVVMEFAKSKPGWSCVMDDHDPVLKGPGGEWTKFYVGFPKWGSPYERPRRDAIHLDHRPSGALGGVRQSAAYWVRGLKEIGFVTEGEDIAKEVRLVLAPFLSSRS